MRFCKMVYCLLFCLVWAPLFGSTWYVRTDGGTRYSSRVTTGQCDGLSDVAYGGKGTNQHCAFNDVRYLWQDGGYNAAGSAFPAYGWVGAGGDTYLIRGSLATGVSYRVGWNDKNASCEGNLCFGVQGNPYAGTPPPPSGTAAQHTRILGENYASCRKASAKTQLHGGFGTGAVLTLDGTSYVDVSCLDITDFSSCGKASQTHGCNTSPGTLDDFATAGITWSRTSTYDTVTDVHIHGMANAGMLGPTGDGVVLSYVDLIGNASSGWNADSGNGITGTGSLLVQHYNISWNGCAEEYPVVHAVPYGDCTDDSTGGYGDGFGTATVASKPGWAAVFDQGEVSYNTQDGLDALHLTGAGSSMTVTHTLAYGNMGQQLKIGGSAGIVRDNIIYTNCNALREAIPGTPPGYNKRLSDFCRAADGGIKVSVNDHSTTYFENNVVYSASATALEVEVNTSCDTSTCLIKQQHNILIGFRNDAAHGYPHGTDELTNPVYVEEARRAYTNAGSLFDHNVTFHVRNTWSCPNTSLHETHAMCGNPHLTDESWHNYGYGNTSPTTATHLSYDAVPGPDSGDQAAEQPPAHALRRAALKYLGLSTLAVGAWVIYRQMRGRANA